MAGAAKCTWCDKTAFAGVRGPAGAELPICPDHYIALQAVENERQRNLSDHARQAMAMMNLASEEMNMATGIPLGGFVAIPPPAPASNYNNISVTNSTIGVLSTAAVGKITAHIGHLPTGNAAKGALQDITAAVANATLDDLTRQNLLDQIAVVAEQAAAEPRNRKAAVVGPMLVAITQGAGAATAVAEAWRSIEPILKAYFGLS